MRKILAFFLILMGCISSTVLVQADVPLVKKTPLLEVSYFERQLRAAEIITPDSDPVLSAALYQKLLTYQKINEQGGWPQITLKRKLEIGASDPVIIKLRHRFGIVDNPESPIFDETVQAALVQFQRSYNLKPDGKLGPKTIAALNVPVHKRIAQILVNMERLRWGSLQNASGKVVIVNIPQYQLTAYENGAPVLSSKVIVGKTIRQTPLLSSQISQLVFNPEWVAPPTIKSKDILPHLRENPEAIVRKGYDIYRDGVRIDPYDVDWAEVSAREFSRYRVAAAPGEKNPLGRVRFTLPDTNSIYLHDTSSRELFAKNDRALSSGCVRVQAWRELMHFALAGNSEMNDARADKILETTKTRYVKLQNAIPVYFIYQTAWLDEGHNLVFGDDIYGYDEKLFNALKDVQTHGPLKTAGFFPL